MTTKRSPNLSAKDVAQIVELLDGWKGRLSWPLLIQAVQARLRAKYSRTALHNHRRIQAAFTARKAAPLEAALVAPTPAQTREDYIRTLKERIARLQRENDELLETHQRWAVNASLKGLTPEYLNQPLASIDRAGRKRRGTDADAG